MYLDHILIVKHGLLTRDGDLSASLYALEGIIQIYFYERFSITRRWERIRFDVMHVF